MLCSRFLRAERGEQHGRVLPAVESASSSACSTLYRRTLAWVMDHRRRDAGVLRARSWSATVVLFMHRAEGLHSRARTPARSVATTEAAEGTSFDAMVQHQQAVAGDRREGPERRGLHVVGRRRRRRGSTEPGPARSSASSRAPSAKLRADQVIRELRPSSPQVPGIRVFLAEPADHPHRRPRQPRACTSSRCRAPTSTRCTTGAPTLDGPAAADLPLLQDVTSDLQITNPQVDVADRPRPRRRAGRHARRRSRHALYNAYGSRQVSTIYTPNNQYWVILELLPAVPARPDGARACSTSARAPAALVPLGAVAQARRRRSAR